MTTRLLQAMVALTLVATTATAQRDTIRISGLYNTGGRPGIAVLPVRGENGDSVRAILQRDLDNGDRVTIVGYNADDLPLVSGVPNFDVFAKLSVARIVQATLTPNGAAHITLYDVAQKQMMQTDNFPLTGPPLSPEWRMSLHIAADEVERWATGTAGISATRIAFARGNQIWQVDSDGECAMPIAGTDGGRSPAWHPTGRYIAFHVLTSDGVQIAYRDLSGASTTRLTSSRSGSNITPVFSPDGTTLVYAAGEIGSDLFATNWLHGGARRKITLSGANNTSPTFSPDGRRVAYTSGQTGSPQVYISDVDGSNSEMLTTTGTGDQEYRSNPSWSPDGRLIAYQSQIDGRFQIMTISPVGRSVTAHTSDSANEDPNWAPDGRHLVFTSMRTGVSQLWVLDVESGRMRQLTRGSGSVKNGAWSPSLARR